MGISQAQKQPDNLEILKAFSVQYTRTKKIRQPRVLFTYFLALVLPFLILECPFLKTSAAILGATWSIIALILSYVEKEKIKLAAKIQEEFDLAVFQLDRNKILVGDKIPIETIHNLAKCFKGDIDKNWYGNTDLLPYPFEVILCQRSNIVWDWRLRKKYFIFGVILLCVIFALGIVFSLYNEFLLEDYIKVIFLPSSSAFILGYKELNEHYDNFRSKEKLEHKLNTIVEGHLINKTEPTRITLRQFQDIIYILRKCTAVIPNYFAKFYKKGYEARMQAALDSFKKQFTH